MGNLIKPDFPSLEDVKLLKGTAITERTRPEKNELLALRFFSNIGDPKTLADLLQFEGKSGGISSVEEGLEWKM